MRAKKLRRATSTLLEGNPRHWAGVPAAEVDLGPTPIHSQPSRYVRTIWAGKQLGAVRSLRVQGAHNGKDILLRLEWPDGTADRDHGDGLTFPDAAAALFPLADDAPLLTMGTDEAPVNAWYWQASQRNGGAENIIARGLGTVEETAESPVQASASWSAGRWRLVLARPLSPGAGGGVALEAGGRTKIAFAVWDGSQQERAGLKSFSKRWLDMGIDA